MKYLFGFICGLIVFSIVQLSMASKDSTTVKQKAGETVEASKEYAVEKKKEFETKLKTELDELNVEIAKLKDKAKETGREAKYGVQDQIAELETKRKDVAVKLEKLSKSTGKAWEKM